MKKKNLFHPQHPVSFIHNAVQLSSLSAVATKGEGWKEFERQMNSLRPIVGQMANMAQYAWENPVDVAVGITNFGINCFVRPGSALLKVLSQFKNSTYLAAALDKSNKLVQNFARGKTLTDDAKKVVAPSNAILHEAGKAVQAEHAALRSTARATHAGGAARTGTVWDHIKPTGVMYPNTKIPKSFEISLGDKKLWVAPNATKHMLEYIAEAGEISHNMPINSQTLLHSFKSAVEHATASGIKYTKDPFVIDCWELMFSPPRADGLLSAVKHAIYKPKGLK